MELSGHVAGKQALEEVLLRLKVNLQRPKEEGVVATGGNGLQMGDESKLHPVKGLEEAEAS